MELRSVLKFLREFAERELREKRADRVNVCRVKRKSVLRKGRLLELRVWMVEGTHYLICVFYGGTLRIYYMDKLGKMLGAEEFTGTEREKVQGNILKKTKSVFRLQPSPPLSPTHSFLIFFTSSHPIN